MRTLVDYLRNALASGLVGFLVAVALQLAWGSPCLPFSFAGACALTGAVCGTASKGIVEGAFSLFGRRRALAYGLNAAVILIIVSGFVAFYTGDLRDMGPATYVIGFLGPILGSSFLLSRALKDAENLTKAFERKRRELDDKPGTP